MLLYNSRWPSYQQFLGHVPHQLYRWRLTKLVLSLERFWHSYHWSVSYGTYLSSLLLMAALCCTYEPTKLGKKTWARSQHKSRKNEKELSIRWFEFKDRAKHFDQKLWSRKAIYIQVQNSNALFPGSIINSLESDYSTPSSTNLVNVGVDLSAIKPLSASSLSIVRMGHPSSASIRLGQKAQNHPIIKCLQRLSFLKIYLWPS